MIKFFKQLFCKHSYNTIEIIPIKNDPHATFLKRKCFKCGKEKAGLYWIPEEIRGRYFK